VVAQDISAWASTRKYWAAMHAADRPLRRRRRRTVPANISWHQPIPRPCWARAGRSARTEKRHCAVQLRRYVENAATLSTSRRGCRVRRAYDTNEPTLEIEGIRTAGRKDDLRPQRPRRPRPQARSARSARAKLVAFGIGNSMDRRHSRPSPKCAHRRGRTGRMTYETRCTRSGLRDRAAAALRSATAWP